MEDVEDVKIVSREVKPQKFILVEITQGKKSRIILRSSVANFHSEIYQELLQEIKGKFKTEPKGGGKLLVDDNSKTIQIWGTSTSYGDPDYKMAKTLLQRKYADYKINITDEI